jgi:polyhydroxybutyrate depolymerase
MLAGMALAIGAMEPALGCAAESRCDVAGGYYLWRAPAGWDGSAALPAIVYFHGWQGSAEDVLADTAMKKALDDAGILLIAPNGAGRTWSYPGSPGRHRDEFAFVSAVLDDAEARLPLRRDRLVASGFSQGGSMVWNLACRLAPRFAAFAPIAGAFWRPHPEHCATPPIRLRHVHGTADRTVPMEGRTLRGGVYRQGDVREGWALWLKANACPPKPPVTERAGGLSCETWADCGSRRRLSLCLHDGGHDMDSRWLVEAVRWLEEEIAAGR